MADLKITQLTAGTPLSTDLHVAVDVTDNSMAPSGTDKKYTWSDLKADVLQLTAAGQVAFGDTTPTADVIGDNNFVWDNTNKALGIGTATPSTKAVLDLTSTTKGMLAPRMTTTQRNAIAAPVTGLLIFNTTTVEFEFWNGSAWVSVASSVATTGTTSQTFTGIWAATHTATLNYQIVSNQVTLSFPSVLFNATIAATITNTGTLPAAIRPAAKQYLICPAQNDGVIVEGSMTVDTTGALTIGVNTVGINNVQLLQNYLGTSAVGTSGFNAFTVTYSLV